MKYLILHGKLMARKKNEKLLNVYADEYAYSGKG
jgi:hypothetical protein